MLGGHLHRKDPKQAQWTSEKLPVPPAKQHVIKHTGTKEAGLSVSICLHGLDTIIWVTAFQKGTMSYDSKRYCLDEWVNQQKTRKKGF